MGVSHKTKKNKLDKIIRELDKLEKKAVVAGALKGDHKWLAHIHEFGCDITVTPGIRAHLHSQGLHLKDSTTRIRIPERSFLRSGYDKNRDRILNHGKMMMADVTGGTMSAYKMLCAVGKETSSGIKDCAQELRSPANHPFTIDQKGSSKPLVGKTGDSGHMIDGITYRVVNK